MTATRRELAAAALLITSVSLASLALGAVAGVSHAREESALRLADAQEAHAKAALMILDCHILADSCLAAVGRGRP